MREISFKNMEELKEAIKGNFIASGTEASIYRYKRYIALRIYDVDDGLYCKVTGKIIGKPDCEKALKNLLLYKDNVKLSSFPIGIVKVNDIVIGQIIKFYDNSLTLKEYFEANPETDPIPYYLRILDILEELCLNNICYEDVHAGNFLIVGDKIRIIDFSSTRVKVNEHFNEMYYPMFQNFNSMVNLLNYYYFKDQYNKLEIPPEIKKDTENIKEDFGYIRNLILELPIKKNKTK